MEYINGYVIENIKNKYKLNNISSEFISINRKKIFDKYGFYTPTIDSYIAVKEDEMGIYFTKMISEKFINIIKQIFNNNEYSYNLKNDFLLDLDLENFMSYYNNITIEELGLLNNYCNNKENFIKYLNLLNRCEPQTKELILNIIKPLSFILINKPNYYDSHMLNYIRDDSKKNNIDTNKKFYTNNGYNKKFNIYFLKEFEYFYLELFALFDEIIKNNSCNDILRIFIKIKEYVYQNIPKTTGNIKYEPVYEYIKYDDSKFHNENECYCPNTKTRIEITGTKKIDTINFKQKEILNIKKLITLLFSMLYNEQINYKEILEINCNTTYVNDLLNLITEENKVKKICK